VKLIPIIETEARVEKKEDSRECGEER